MIRAGVECGQRLWRPRSWAGPNVFRRFPSGFAVGPIMVWRRARGPR